jgi:hypothetical protein
MTDLPVTFGKSDRFMGKILREYFGGRMPDAHTPEGKEYIRIGSVYGRRAFRNAIVDGKYGMSYGRPDNMHREAVDGVAGTIVDEPLRE